MLNSAYKRGDYEWLYANYLTAKHGRLSVAVDEFCQDYAPDSALDLCAGSGAMTRVLISHRIPHIVAVDQSPAMLNHIHSRTTPIDGVFCNVQSWVLDLNDTKAYYELRRAFLDGVDIITCRQGIGYLRRCALVRIPQLLSPGGSFMFNSFLEPPTRQLWWHRRGSGIFETGFYSGRKRQVYHAQLRWPRVDFTHFTWHDVVGDLIPEWERAGFGVSVQTHGRTLIIEVSKPLH